MKLTAGRVRFLLEAAFIVVVAAVCAASHLTWRGIVPAIAGAWLLVTLVEHSATKGDSEPATGKYRFGFGRRTREEPAAAESEEEMPPPPPPSHVTVLESEPEQVAEQPPMPAPSEPAPPVPEPAPPVPEPEPTPEPGEPVPQLELVPEPEPERDPEPAEEPEPEPVANVAVLPPRDGAAREWNVWELEKVAREIEGRDAARDQELAFLLVELRQFADPDGRLASTFDPVVRESFGELLYASA